MPELKQTFQGGKMEKDIDERIVPNSQYREALNIGVATSEDSDVGAAQNILGNLKVTEAIQSRTWTELSGGGGAGQSSFDVGGREYAGDNYHIAAIVNPKTDMLYRFINTESENEGIWMDRIVEYWTKTPYYLPWTEKETAVMVDIYKVKATVNFAEENCQGGNKYQIRINKNTNQVRWGMAISVENIGLTIDKRVIVEYVNYSTGVITLDTNIANLGFDPMGQIITFHGDRNLNFHKDRHITGINILDGVLFWTDNYSEPKKVHIERGIMGSNSALHASNPLLVGRGVDKIDDFNQHTLLIVEDMVPEDSKKDDSFCDTFGCMDITACNYDPLVTIDDGSCIFPDGCTDPLACNYDAAAECDDGSCEFTSCVGCMDNTMWNYDPNATIACNGCCIPFIYGCTDNTACNYDPLANTLDTSCILPDGCTDITATNYDPAALCDDGSCLYGLWECLDVGYANDDCEVQMDETILPWSYDPINYPNAPSGVINWTTPPGAPPFAWQGHEELIIDYWANSQNGMQNALWDTEWFWYSDVTDPDCPAGWETDGVCNFQVQDNYTNYQCLTKKKVSRLTLKRGTRKAWHFVTSGVFGNTGILFNNNPATNAPWNQGTVNGVNYEGVVNPAQQSNQPCFCNDGSCHSFPASNQNNTTYEGTWVDVITYLRTESIFDGNMYCIGINDCSNNPSTPIQVPEVTLSMSYGEVKDIITSTYNFGDPSNQPTTIQCDPFEIVWDYEDCNCSGVFYDQTHCEVTANGIHASEVDCNTAGCGSDGLLDGGIETATIYTS